jgi:hypothetical protein
MSEGGAMRRWQQQWASGGMLHARCERPVRKQAGRMVRHSGIHVGAHSARATPSSLGLRRAAINCMLAAYVLSVV